MLLSTNNARRQESKTIQLHLSKSILMSNNNFKKSTFSQYRFTINLNFQNQKKLEYFRIKIRKLKQQTRSMHQTRLFFKNNRIDEIFKQFRRIKIISNVFYHCSKFEKLNSINFDL